MSSWSGTSFAKCKRFLRFFQNAYFPSTEFMGVHFFSPVWFLTRTLLQSRAWISILRKWQWKFQCKGLPLQFRTHNVYNKSTFINCSYDIYPEVCCKRVYFHQELHLQIFQTSCWWPQWEFSFKDGFAAEIQLDFAKVVVQVPASGCPILYCKGHTSLCWMWSHRFCTCS